MRVINVIVVKRRAVYSIDSFRVFESTGLMANIAPDINKNAVEKAENLFVSKVLEISGESLEDFENNRGPMDSFIEDGIFIHNDIASSSVCLTWSELE